MTQETLEKLNHVRKILNPILVIGFLMLSAYHIIVTHDRTNILISLAFALMFDQTFDRTDRPRWNLVWLIVKLIVTICVLIYAFFVL